MINSYFKFMLFTLFLLIVVAFLLVPARATALQTVTPQTTTVVIKACHVCEEEAILPTATPSPPITTEPETVVHAVLFWSNGCPHCHYVLDEVLPPLQQTYRDQLEILLIETSSPEKTELLFQAAETFGIPREGIGVPLLVIGDVVLVGSAQIPAELPGLIEKHLAAGGLDYPDIPGLAPLLPIAIPAEEEVAPQPTATPTVDSSQIGVEEPIQASPTFTPTPAQVVQLFTDLPSASATTEPPTALATPNGFGLAIGIMVAMVAALIYAAVVIIRGVKNHTSRPVPAWLDLAIPLLAVVGLGVAGYLAYVETQVVSAVCGPVGDCNAVQASSYAKLFGILPVGVLGAAGYIAILMAWLWRRFGSGSLAGDMPLVMFGMTLFGVLFSLYLTYLEPFVIRAVCMWCLTSAVLITLLMLLSLNPALQTIQTRTGERKI